MSLVLGVEILGEYRQLTQATQGAQKELTGLNAGVSKISSSIKNTLGAIGIGFSFVAITRELKDAALAAEEDARSQALLKNAMQNTVGATDAQIASAESLISSLQIQTATTDDKLRPAYAKLLRATNDIASANDLLSLALDVSAGSGKSLDSVATALAKSLAGSDTALVKLLPSVKDVADPMAYLKEQFGGAAQNAADVSGYERMQIIFGEMQEQIGTALLPTLEEFSTWLATPEGQKKLKEITDGITGILTIFTELVGYIVENKDWFVPLVAGTTAIVKGWNSIKGAIDAAKTAQLLFNSAAAAAPAATGTVAGIGGLSLIGGALAGGNADAFISQETKDKLTQYVKDRVAADNAKNKIGILNQKTTGTGTGVNIYVKEVADAQTIIKNLNKFEKTTGSGLKKVIMK